MTGRISVTTDINVVYDNISSCKVITIVDVDNITSELKAISTIAPFMLPPYEVVSRKLCDEDESVFSILYSQYLHQGEPLEFIAILYKALLQGVNILLYFPSDYELFINELLFILANEFGFWFDGDIGLNMGYIGFINVLLYLYDLISPYELLCFIKDVSELPREVIGKLSEELFLPYEVMTYEQIVQYINNMLHKQRASEGSILRNIWRVDNNASIHK